MDYDDGYLCQDCPLGYTGQTLRGYDLLDANTLQQVYTFLHYVYSASVFLLKISHYC